MTMNHSALHSEDNEDSCTGLRSRISSNQLRRTDYGRRMSVQNLDWGLRRLHFLVMKQE